MRTPLTVLLCGCLTLTAQAQTATGAGRLEDALRDLVDDGVVRAAVVGHYDGDSTRFVGIGAVGGGAGSRPPGADDVFEIGSISKVFTALLTERLVRAGRLDWDAPISRYLPDVGFASDAVAAITLRELATHRSGLPRLPDNLEITDPDDPYAGYGRAELTAFLESHAPSRLEKHYGYSNLGAGLLGLIAGDAAGGGYAAALRRELLDPLDMNATQSGLVPPPDGLLVRGFSEGQDAANWGGFDALAGAGALLSTAADLMAFARLNLTDNPQRPLLDAIRVAQHGGPTALGWHVDGSGGDTTFWHNGGTGGYASYLGLHPGAGRAVVVLTASTAYAEITDLGEQLLQQTPPAHPPLPLAAYSGAYRLDGNMVLTVFEQRRRLYAQATGQGAFPLKFEPPDRFSHAAAGIVITFDTDAAGQVVGLELDQGGSRRSAARVSDAEGPQRYEPIERSAAQLAPYAGRYRFSRDAVLTVELQGDQLRAQLSGQPFFPVYAYAPDRFFYRVVDAQLEFERAADGQVVAVVLHQGGEQRAPRIDDD